MCASCYPSVRPFTAGGNEKRPFLDSKRHSRGQGFRRLRRKEKTDKRPSVSWCRAARVPPESSQAGGRDVATLPTPGGRVGSAAGPAARGQSVRAGLGAVRRAALQTCEGKAGSGLGGGRGVRGAPASDGPRASTPRGGRQSRGAHRTPPGLQCKNGDKMKRK